MNSNALENINMQVGHSCPTAFRRARMPILLKKQFPPSRVRLVAIERPQEINHDEPVSGQCRSRYSPSDVWYVCQRSGACGFGVADAIVFGQWSRASSAGFSGHNPRHNATVDDVQWIRQMAVFTVDQTISTIWPERNVAQLNAAQRGIDR